MTILRDPISGDNSGGSPSPQDANTPAVIKQPEAASSPATENDANKGDFAEQALVEFNKNQPAIEEVEKPAGSSPTNEGQAEAQPPAGDVRLSNKTDKKDEPQTQDEYADLPFHKHARFQELAKERKALKEAAEQTKPHIERLRMIDDFCLANGIAPEQFKDVLEITALINTNPTEAYKRLQPTLDHLAKYQGQVLPEDLQKKVEAGTLGADDAKEIAALRSQREFATQRSQQTVAQQRNQMLFNTLSSWESQMRQKDPDYGRKQQMIVDRFVALSASSPWQTPEQVFQLAQKAYDDVNNFVAGFVPRPQATVTLTTNGSPGAPAPEPKSWDEVQDHLVRKFSSARR